MNALLELDAEILLWIQENMRTDLMTVIMKAITRLGDGGALWIVLAVVLLVIGKTRRVGLASVVSLVITFLVVNLGLKNIVARTRPYEVIDGLKSLVGEQSDYSFPSGHTAHAFAVGVIMLAMLPKRIGRPIIIVSVLMAYSRLYLGVHYLTDVLAGAVFGTLIALLSMFFVDKISVRWARRNREIEIEEQELMQRGD